MEKISSDILALISEAAVLVRAGKIHFANASALEIAGRNCIGKSVLSVFGPEVAGSQSSAFIAEVPVRGRVCMIRVSKFESGQIIFISPSAKPDAILNEPFLCSMRNSLMSVELSANLLRDRAEELDDPELLKHLSLLARNYYRMTRLINNASFVLNEDESLSVSALSTVNLSALYGELLESLKFFTNGVEIKYSLGSNIIISCDAALIRKLLLNLVSNCLSHARGCTVISVNLMSSGENVVLSVSDDGCGIDPDSLHMVFERYRYGFSLAELGNGAGLGLTVVRRIARMHGGTLLLESRRNYGTTVRVSIGKRISPVRNLCSPHTHQDSSRNDILLECSDCLEPEFYSEKFMD